MCKWSLTLARRRSLQMQFTDRSIVLVQVHRGAMHAGQHDTADLQPGRRFEVAHFLTYFLAAE